jgi:hypothetical protein
MTPNVAWRGLWQFVDRAIRAAIVDGKACDITPAAALAKTANGMAALADVTWGIGFCDLLHVWKDPLFVLSHPASPQAESL